MIQWSVAQTPSRARSRRRVGEATAVGAPMPNTPILMDDDEEDVAFFSARAYAQAKNKARVDAHRPTRATPHLAVEASLEEANRARGSAMEDLLGIPLDPLEWRLGPGGGKSALSGVSVLEEATCVSSNEELRSTVVVQVKEFIKGRNICSTNPLKYAVAVNRRGLEEKRIPAAASFGKVECINVVGEAIRSHTSDISVNLTDPLVTLKGLLPFFV